MHHAYFFEGGLSQLSWLADEARERFDFEKENNPDVYINSHEKFAIDDAHALRARAAYKSTSGRALYIIGIGSVTSEAQQALLKLFEEPQQGAIFILLVPHGVLLPTLRSRMLEYTSQNAAPAHLGNSQRSHPQHSASFLKASQKERSEIIADLLDEEDGVKERVREFLRGVEVKLYTQIKKTEARAALEDIAKVRSYINDRSPALKMLLEHLALSLPQM